MKVILKKDVQSVGETGDVVNVADGFARNFLLPTNAAEIATEGALKNRERNLERIKAKAEKLHQEALAKSEKIKELGQLEISAKAGENGKLFGAITTRRLADDILEKSGIEVDRRNLSLNNPINHVGEYQLKIKLTSKVELTLPVVVKASEIVTETSVEEIKEVEQTEE